MYTLEFFCSVCAHFLIKLGLFIKISSKVRVKTHVTWYTKFIFLIEYVSIVSIVYIFWKLGTIKVQFTQFMLIFVVFRFLFFYLFILIYLCICLLFHFRTVKKIFIEDPSDIFNAITFLQQKLNNFDHNPQTAFSENRQMLSTYSISDAPLTNTCCFVKTK